MSSKRFSEGGRIRGRRIVQGLAAAAAAGLVIVSAAAGTTTRGATAPGNSSLPAISGSTSTGSSLTANPGTWSGSAPISFQYQWQICGAVGEACHDISGATAQTYGLKNADLGNTVRVHVIASNSDGSASATSPASARISSGVAAPTNSSPPTISGDTTVGATLTANAGTWNGSAPITFAYQWQICGAIGEACHDISAAAAQTYQLKPEDPGNTVRVRVTGSNPGGSSAATSDPTARIGAPAPPPNGCPKPAAGAQAVAVADITAPARLQLTQFQPTPAVITRSLTSFTVRFHVANTCGQAVQGAQVYATAVPFGQVTIPGQQATDANGDVTLQFNRLGGFPASNKQQLLVLFVRATKPGDPVLAGISTRRLISLRVNLHAR